MSEKHDVPTKSQKRHLFHTRVIISNWRRVGKQKRKVEENFFFELGHFEELLELMGELKQMIA